VGLERRPHSLVCTIEGLLESKNSGSGLESREYGRKDPSCRPRGTLYPRKLALTSPTSGGLSVGIVRSRTQTMQFSFFSNILRGVQFHAVAFWLIHCTKSRKVLGSRSDEVNQLPIYLILLIALGSEVYSASNRNEYQNQKNNVSGE
jgi:hypothetical protein